MSYASGTSVPVEKSISEIQRLVTRFGADKFGYMMGNDFSQIAFEIDGKAVRIRLQLPNRNDKKFQMTNHNPPRERTREQAFDAWESECRRKWRAQTLLVKAKMVAIEENETTVEREFLADLLLPEGQTVEEVVMSKIAQAYEDGCTPPLLLLE